MNTQIATIPKKVSGGNELIVVRKKDFQIFEKWHAQINDALAKVKRGREEYNRKKTVIALSTRKFR